MEACTSQILDMVISDLEAHSRECERRIESLRSLSEAIGPAPTVVYGDSFAHDSPRQRRERARNLVNNALGIKP